MYWNHQLTLKTIIPELMLTNVRKPQISAPLSYSDPPRKHKGNLDLNTFQNCWGKWNWHASYYNKIHANQNPSTKKRISSVLQHQWNQRNSKDHFNPTSTEGNTSNFDSKLDTKWILRYNSEQEPRATESHDKSQKLSLILDDWAATHNNKFTNQQTPQRTNDSTYHYQQQKLPELWPVKNSYQRTILLFSGKWNYNASCYKKKNPFQSKSFS